MNKVILHENQVVIFDSENTMKNIMFNFIGGFFVVAGSRPGKICFTIDQSQTDLWVTCGKFYQAMLRKVTEYNEKQKIIFRDLGLEEGKIRFRGMYGSGMSNGEFSLACRVDEEETFFEIIVDLEIINLNKRMNLDIENGKYTFFSNEIQNFVEQLKEIAQKKDEKNFEFTGDRLFKKFKVKK